MRICIFLLFSFLCFLNCSNQGSGSETSANNALPVQTSNVVTNDNRNANTVNAVNGQTSNRKKLGNFTVDAFIDNELERRSTYRDGLCVRDITFNTQTKKQESEIEYFYKKSGELDHVKMIQGDESPETQLEADKYFRDFVVQNQILNSKGIDFPLPDIAVDEVRDLSKILSVADNYSDFKTERRADGNQKVIKFVDFNKNIRFQPSTLTLVAGNNPIQIRDFELILENDFPIKETLKTNDGELIKTYSYKDGHLIGVVYKFTDLENRTNSLEKRFEYHELNQKP